MFFGILLQDIEEVGIWGPPEFYWLFYEWLSIELVRF